LGTTPRIDNIKKENSKGLNLFSHSINRPEFLKTSFACPSESPAPLTIFMAVSCCDFPDRQAGKFLEEFLRHVAVYEFDFSVNRGFF